jgi:DNA-binding Lrp family transcriptional regulator
MPIAGLAKLVGLAPSSVHERIRRLEQRGVIRAWRVDVDPAAVGRPVTAFVGVEADRPCSDVVPSLEPFPEIEECHSVGGGLSFLLKVRTASPEALLDLVERLRRVDGIVRTETSVVLRTQLERGTTVS